MFFPWFENHIVVDTIGMFIGGLVWGFLAMLITGGDLREWGNVRIFLFATAGALSAYYSGVVGWLFCAFGVYTGVYVVLAGLVQSQTTAVREYARNCGLVTVLTAIALYSILQQV